MKANPRLPLALIVTADDETRLFLKRTLQLSFQLMERADLNSAKETLELTYPDLIVLDSKDLEEASLFQALSQIRQVVGRKKTPILLITNNLKKKFAQDALRSGASDFINRPLDEDEIEQRMAVAFQSFETAQSIAGIAKRSTPQMAASAPTLTHRTFLNDQAIKEIAKAREDGEHVSLLVLETSRKDEIISHILQDSLRRHDILIPQGPGKYLLMLPKTSRRAAELIGETIQADLEQKLYPITVSIGQITWDRSQVSHGSAAEEFDHLIKSASSAMKMRK